MKFSQLLYRCSGKLIAHLNICTVFALSGACSPINVCEQSVAQLGATYAVRVRLECKQGDAACPTFQEYSAKRKALDLQCLPQSKP